MFITEDSFWLLVLSESLSSVVVPLFSMRCFFFFFLLELDVEALCLLLISESFVVRLSSLRSSFFMFLNILSSSFCRL